MMQWHCYSMLLLALEVFLLDGVSVADLQQQTVGLYVEVPVVEVLDHLVADVAGVKADECHAAEITVAVWKADGQAVYRGKARNDREQRGHWPAQAHKSRSEASSNRLTSSIADARASSCRSSITQMSRRLRRYAARSS